MAETFVQQEGDALRRIEKAMPDLSKADIKIAKFLLTEPEKIIREAVRSVANEIGVSEPTIIRFCRTMGYDGFKDFKIQLAQDLAFRQAARDAREMSDPTPMGEGNDSKCPSKVRDEITRGANAAISRAAASYLEEDYDNAATALANAKRITIMGIGGSSAILAQEMHNRLFRLSLHSNVFVDSYQQRMSAATSSKEDVVLIISSTGRPKSLLDSIELAKHYGATTIAITPLDSHLGYEAEICIDVKLKQGGVDPFQPNPMRFEQLFAIDCLAYKVAIELGQHAEEALRRTRASVASLHGIAPQQPIGD